jgi:hypothetical protein
MFPVGTDRILMEELASNGDLGDLSGISFSGLVLQAVGLPHNGPRYNGRDFLS